MANPNLPVIDNQGVRVGIQSIQYNNSNVNNATQMTITTNRLQNLQDFSTFNVGAGRSVVLNQLAGNNANFLARVTGTQASTIAGNVRGNGNFWLANPNGVLISPTGSITNFQGVVATTNRYTNTQGTQFLNGNVGAALQQTQLGTNGVTNQGRIQVGNLGFVVLSGGVVQNQSPSNGNGGIIEAPAGNVTLVAANRVTLATTTGNRITLAPNQLGQLQGTTGFHHVVNQQGVVRANSVGVNNVGEVVLGSANQVNLHTAPNSTFLPRVEVTNTHGGRGGRIEIAANQLVTQGGTLDASSVGNGGQINISSGGNVFLNGPISARGGSQANSDFATAGSVRIYGGGQVHTNTIDVSSQGQGGLIEISALDALNVNGLLDARNTASGKLGAGGGYIALRGVNQLVVQNRLLASSINTNNGRGGNIQILSGATPVGRRGLQLLTGTVLDAGRPYTQGNITIHAQNINVLPSVDGLNDVNAMGADVLSQSRGNVLLASVGATNIVGNVNRVAGNRGSFTVYTGPHADLTFSGATWVNPSPRFTWNDTVALHVGGRLLINRPVTTTGDYVAAYLGNTELRRDAYSGQLFTALRNDVYYSGPFYSSSRVTFGGSPRGTVADRFNRGLFIYQAY
ncbi:MAG: filamentous hemagglutinin N-terminal domain-containing protein [Vampirovibrionales bacterium]